MVKISANRQVTLTLTDKQLDIIETALRFYKQVRLDYLLGRATAEADTEPSEDDEPAIQWTKEELKTYVQLKMDTEDLIDKLYNLEPRYEVKQQ